MNVGQSYNDLGGYVGQKSCSYRHQYIISSFVVCWQTLDVLMKVMLKNTSLGSQHYQYTISSTVGEDTWICQTNMREFNNHTFYFLHSLRCNMKLDCTPYLFCLVLCKNLILSIPHVCWATHAHAKVLIYWLWTCLKVSLSHIFLPIPVISYAIMD